MRCGSILFVQVVSLESQPQATCVERPKRKEVATPAIQAGQVAPPLCYSEVSKVVPPPFEKRRHRRVIRPDAEH